MTNLLAPVVGVVVAVVMFVVGGGRYALPVDVMVCGTVGLVAAVGVQLLAERAAERRR